MRHNSDPKSTRGIVFDKDGTLFDFHASWSAWTDRFIREVTADDPQRAAALAAALGYDLEARAFDRDSPMISGTMEVVVEAVHDVLPEFETAALRGLIRESTAAAPLVEAVPLVPLFDRFAGAGLALGLATNDGEQPARAHLQRAGLLDRFAFVAGYDSGHGAKPEPGMLSAFCGATGLAPDVCVMVGDSRDDLASGRAAGMRTVGVLTGLATRDELAPLADAVLPDIGALPEWLAL